MQAKLITLTCAAFVATATTALADREMVSKHGVVYAQTPYDTVTLLKTRSETITLTEGCTARIDGRGIGKWTWTSQGTRVTVGSYRVSFDDVPAIPVARCAG